MLVGIKSKHKHMKHNHFSFLVSDISNQMHHESFSDRPLNKLITSVKHNINDILCREVFFVVEILKQIYS